ncbi:hypothetical protein AMELA_G00103980 [Ameiurus melas]|uniref:Uncharacterized protein n=1 Tax=Ameiurus melas TaxID=219545 RepID=A0A7J6AU27_AMEME|nr:hypothetical protein AMELA_G00103980 [Ameiurus melas]
MLLCTEANRDGESEGEREKAMAGETDADILLQSGPVSRNKWKHRTSASSVCADLREFGTWIHFQNWLLSVITVDALLRAGPSAERREGAFQNRRIERAAPAASQRCSCL